MALRFDRNLGRFRDERGRFVTRTRGLKSSIARPQYLAAPMPRAAPRAPRALPDFPGVIDLGRAGAVPSGMDQPFQQHAFDPEVFDDFGIDDDGEDSYSNDEN